MQVLTLRVFTVILFKFIHKRPGESHLLLHIMMNFKGLIKKLLKKNCDIRGVCRCSIILGISSQDGLKMVLYKELNVLLWTRSIPGIWLVNSNLKICTVRRNFMPGFYLHHRRLMFEQPRVDKRQLVYKCLLFPKYVCPFISRRWLSREIKDL